MTVTAEKFVTSAASLMSMGASAAVPARDRDVEKPAISVIGLGYVGAVSMACFSSLGFRMVGVDVSPEKVDAIGAGRSPIVEERLGDLLAEGHGHGLVSATDNLVAAVLQTDVTLVSVGTPTAEDGSCDLTFVRVASRAIGQAIAMKDSYHVVVLRCSVPPGTTLDVVAPEIERASGKRLGHDFGVCFNPEFLREGVAIADFFDPPKTVVGASDERAAATVSAIYEAIDDGVIYTSIEAAEMVKYVDNVWHAAKVTFGNEVGRLCKALSIDSHDVMDIFVRDTKLNLSPYYLRPGFAFGGSCLPKEVRAVGHLAHGLDVSVPLIDSLMVSNRRHVEEAMSRLAPFSGKRIGFLGVTFKPGTDDLRESPTLDLMAELVARGETIGAYDPNVSFGPSLQSQIAYVRHAVPRQAKLMDTLEDVMFDSAEALLAASDVVVVSHATREFRLALEARAPTVHVLDLARVWKVLPQQAGYEGIAW
ncbi:MAG: nucleotide sugar dehydrogenase [Hyphomicrobiaceae bacterium]|nr:nucleotide sugar dehydrogenase [Hyphomicrobiaceae bacterium]